MSDWISTQIDYVTTGTRALTTQLWQVVMAHLEILEKSGDWQKRQILLKSLEPVQRLWHSPTREECDHQLSLLCQEADELAPWVETWPEHRSENTVAFYKHLHAAINHFTQKLREFQLAVAS